MKPGNPFSSGMIETDGKISRAYVDGELCGSTDTIEQLLIDIKLNLEAIEGMVREAIERKVK